jgi:hypothetical protein
MHMMHAPVKPRPPRELVARLASLVPGGADLRTIEKALMMGPEAVRGDLGARIRQVLVREGIISESAEEKHARERRDRENAKISEMIEAHAARLRRVIQVGGYEAAERVYERSPDALRRFLDGDSLIVGIILRQLAEKADAAEAFLLGASKANGTNDQ